MTSIESCFFLCWRMYQLLFKDVKSVLSLRRESEKGREIYDQEVNGPSFKARSSNEGNTVS